MYALANVTMSSNYNVVNMVKDGIRVLSPDELNFVSGGAFSWADLGATMLAGAATGAMLGAAGGPGGIGLGALGGALTMGAGYYVYTYSRMLLD